MTDHDFERRLRLYFREEVDQTRAAPIAMRQSLSALAIAGRRDQFDSRRWMLLAAAALIATLVAGVAAVGSGLIRVPEPRPAAIPLDDCKPTLADELVLAVWRERSGETFVYGDGRVIASGWVTRSNGAPVDKILRQRHLTPEGLADLLASAIDPGLKGCRDVPIDGADDLHVTVRDGGSLNEFHTGYGAFSAARADQATTTAAAALHQRLKDPDLGMGADEWADSAWTEYRPDRYVMTVTLPSGVVAPATGPWTVALPDGSTPMTFGAVMPDDPAYHYASATPYITRCGFLDVADARAFRDAFPRWAGEDRNNGAAVPFPNGGFFVPFWNLDEYSGLEVNAALPHQRSCADLYPGPDAEEPLRGDPTLAAVDVCALLEGGAMPDERGQQPPGSLVGQAWLHDDLGESSCDFADSDMSAVYRVDLRLEATTAAEAAELVRRDFGIDGYRAMEIAGQHAYLNACAYAALPCEPAIAISTDPYYLFIRGTRQPTAEETEAVLRALAATAIERLGR